MIDPLLSASRLASAGLEAQSLRMRVVSENLANAQSTGSTPGADPYARKTVTFRAELDRAAGLASVRLRESGKVKLPNVNMLVEMADMREANRSYEANLQVIKQARAMVASVIDLLKS